MATEATRNDLDSLKPFRLVKFFTFTGMAMILVFALILSWVISNHAKRVLLERSEAYAYLLAENLNNQVFQQFVLPTVVRYGKIALRNPKQFGRLDTVVRNTTQGLNVDSVTIFDSEENIISYSTISDRVGRRNLGGIEYKKALSGENNSILLSSGSLMFLLPGSTSISCKLKTYIPFRSSKPLGKHSEVIMGVIEIVQDLSDDLEAIIRLQGSIIITSIVIMGGLFFALRQIVLRADQIIDARARERRRLEAKLDHSERLASLGKMVAAVSHEIKNPLGIVRSTAEILGKRLKNIAPGNDHLANIIVEETSRLDGIVMEFLDFARPQIPNMTPTRVNEVINKVIQFMEPEFNKRQIETVVDLDPTLWTMEVDPNLLYRALLNILVNGVQAMDSGGTLRVTTRRGEEPDGMEITIADNGIGMSSAKQKLIFNPFFTDKNRGTGLGLAIAKNIIEGHEGSIAVESEEGLGTTFTITLPGGAAAV